MTGDLIESLSRIDDLGKVALMGALVIGMFLYFTNQLKVKQKEAQDVINNVFAQLKEARGLYEASQEARLSEAKEANAELYKTTGIMTGMTAALEKIDSRLEQMERGIESQKHFQRRDDRRGELGEDQKSAGA